MKKLIVFLIFLTLLAGKNFSANAQSAKSEIGSNACAKYLKAPYISDGQEYKALLNRDEVAEFKATFYAGISYRIAACCGIGNLVEGNIIFSFFDQNRTLLFTNKDYKNSPYWNFEFTATMDCIIEAQLDNNKVIYDSSYLVVLHIIGKMCKIETDSISDDEILMNTNGLFRLPLPAQTSKLVKSLNFPYKKELLNMVDNYANYSTSFKKAMNLGIYCINLSYLHTYNQLSDAVQYLIIIEILSENLSLTNFFGEAAMKRIKNNEKNQDSLIRIMSNICINVLSNPINSEQVNTGRLVFAGSRIETLFMMTQLAQQNKDEELISRIGEQKHPLDNLIELLRPYYGKQQSKEFDKFLESLVDLATTYDGVVIEYSFEKPTVFADKKLTVINSKTKTIINEQQLKEITRMVATIRGKIVE